MSRIAALSPAAIAPPGEGGDVAGADQGAHLSLTDIARVGSIESSHLFGHGVGSEAYQYAFEKTMIEAATRPDEELVELIDAEFPDTGGKTNHSAVSGSLIAAMDMLHESDPYAYAPATQRLANIFVQAPPPGRDLSDTIRLRLDNWTKDLDPTRSAAIRDAVLYKQADLLGDRNPGPVDLLAKAPPLSYGVMASLHAVRWAA